MKNKIVIGNMVIEEQESYMLYPAQSCVVVTPELTREKIEALGITVCSSGTNKGEPAFDLGGPTEVLKQINPYVKRSLAGEWCIKMKPFGRTT